MEVMNGQCSISNRNKFMTVSDKTIAAEVLDDFSKSVGKKGRKKCFEKSG